MLSKKTHEVMNSLEGVHRAEAPPWLWSKVRNRLEPAPSALYGTWRLAAALTVFILANLFTLHHLSRGENSPGGASQAVANEYSISIPQSY